jgi:transcriptional regulator with XRE-family HTH domain
MSGEPIKAFGLVIREMRKKRKVSQEVLSEEAGLDRTFLSQLETGRKQPSLLTIFQLAAALQTNASELFVQVEHKLREQGAR